MLEDRRSLSFRAPVRAFLPSYAFLLAIFVLVHVLYQSVVRTRLPRELVSDVVFGCFLILVLAAARAWRSTVCVTSEGVGGPNRQLTLWSEISEIERRPESGIPWSRSALLVRSQLKQTIEVHDVIVKNPAFVRAVGEFGAHSLLAVHLTQKPEAPSQETASSER